MNFSFMTYILFGILIFFSLKKKNISKLFILVVSLFILISNEIYNHQNYIKNDSFLDYENVNFDRTINPQDYSRNEFQDIIIPNNYNSHLKDGMACYVEKTIKDIELKNRKLDYQEGIINLMDDTLVNHYTDNNPADIREELGDDINIFNPLNEDRLSNNKVCPTVCHLINDQVKCINALNIPNLPNETEFNNWKTRNYDFCEGLTSIDDCNNACQCSYDSAREKCFFDERICISHINSKDEVECENKCEYVIPNDVTDNNLKKSICENAKFSENDTNYCLWDNVRSRCLTNCDKYQTSEECTLDQRCRILNDRCVNN